MSEKDKSAAELEEGEIVFGMAFPADDEPAKVVQPSEKTFDAPAFGVASHPASIIEGGFVSSAAVGGQRQDFLFQEPLAQGIAIIGFVGNQPEGFSSISLCSKVASTKLTSAGAAASV